MKEWQFKAFRKESGKNAIEEWLEGLSQTAQASIRAGISYLEARPPREWVRPFFDTLSGRIHKIRITDIIEKKEYRILGCFGPGDRVFTMLIGAIEKDRKLEPGAKETAKQRYKIVQKYKERCLYDYKWP
jgi:hypothetical protein